MATSYPMYKSEIKEYLKSKYPSDATILDVGAGCGTYSTLLREYFPNIDGVEVYAPNVLRYELWKKYKNIILGDIRDYKYIFYDIIIFGDVIEHLDIEEAQEVLTYAIPRCSTMVVAVPYMYEQGEVDGNTYEIHKQDDLTPEVMKERYPYLELLYGDDKYGYYVKREGEEDGGQTK